MPSTKPLTIGKLARETGVKVVTIRYYEQIGLMPVARARTETTGRIVWNIGGDFILSAVAGTWASRLTRSGISFACRRRKRRHAPKWIALLSSIAVGSKRSSPI